MRKYLVDVVFGLFVFALGVVGGASYMWSSRGGECQVVGQLNAPFQLAGRDSSGQGFSGGFADGSVVVCENGSMFRKK